MLRRAKTRYEVHHIIEEMSWKGYKFVGEIRSKYGWYLSFYK